MIIAPPRTGSNLLCTLLNSHPDILCHHEVFNPNGIFYALNLRDGSVQLGSLVDRDSDPMGFLDRLWQIPTDCSYVGFKMTRGQAPQVLESTLRDRGIKKLLLRRRNRVKTLVSELIAQETDQWELYCAEEKIDPPKIQIGVTQLVDHATENQNFYNGILQTLVSLNQPYIELQYESLTSRIEQERILAFLGVQDPGRSLVPSSVKQTPGDLRTIISNFSELDSALSGTEYHRELHDLGS